MITENEINLKQIEFRNWYRRYRASHCCFYIDLRLLCSLSVFIVNLQLGQGKYIRATCIWGKRFLLMGS